MKKRPIDYRDTDLVLALLGLFYEADVDLDPAEAIALFASDTWKPDTIKRTIADLVDLGAIRRVQQKNRHERALLRMTGLGRAWCDRELEPYVPRLGNTEPDPPGEEDAGREHDPDPDPEG